MISSGSTVLRFDFDIFSIAPIATRSPSSRLNARGGPRAPASISTSAGESQSPVRVAIGLVHHHALREEAGERLLQVADMAGRLHRAGEEAGIEQMQDRVLDAADILIDRQPCRDRRGVVGASRSKDR